MTATDLDAVWEYYRLNTIEIDRDIWWEDTTADIGEGEPVPNTAIVEGLLLGVDDATLRTAFDSPLTDAQISAAWDEYRRTPNRQRPSVSALSAAG